MILFWPNAVTWVPSTEDAAADQLLFGGTLFECQEIPPSAEVNTPKTDCDSSQSLAIHRSVKAGNRFHRASCSLPQVTPEFCRNKNPADVISGNKSRSIGRHGYTQKIRN